MWADQGMAKLSAKTFWELVIKCSVIWCRRIFQVGVKCCTITAHTELLTGKLSWGIVCHLSRLTPALLLQIKVSEKYRGIPHGLHQLRFRLFHKSGRPGIHVHVHPSRVTAGHQARPRWAADSAASIKISKPNSLGGHPVDSSSSIEVFTFWYLLNGCSTAGILFITWSICRSFHDLHSPGRFCDIFRPEQFSELP